MDAARPTSSSDTFHPSFDPREDIERVILTEDQIQRRVAELGQEIAAVCADTDAGLTIVTILAGSIIFLADLIRYLPMKMRIDLVTVSSYPGQATKTQGARLLTERPLQVEDRDVIIVDDILDSGNTLRLVSGEVIRAGARSVRTAVLLRKPGKAPADVGADFLGFDIEDKFVVGYGLDYDSHYRNLPYVGVLKPHLYGGT